ncbi:MAG: helix-turn-helix domain-containing protein [bacterium]
MAIIYDPSKLFYEMVKNDINKKEMAKELGIDPGTLSRKLKNESKFDAVEAYKAAKKVDRTVEEILFSEGVPESDKEELVEV